MPSRPARARFAGRCSSAQQMLCCPACTRWASPSSAASPAPSPRSKLSSGSPASRGSTGIVFAAPFAASVAVGRLGCFFSGLADFTYGTPTGAALGGRFRRRHSSPSGPALRIARDGRDLRRADPSASRAATASGSRTASTCPSARMRSSASSGSSSSPMQPSLGPFNLFHLVCLGLILYAAVMIRSRPRMYDRIARRPRPISSSARPPACARPASAWCRPRSSARTAGSTTPSAAPSTA